MLNQPQDPKTDAGTLIHPSDLKVNALMLLSNGESEILRFEKNGDIFVKGKLITNDMQVVDGFRELLRLNNLMN